MITFLSGHTVDTSVHDPWVINFAVANDKRTLKRTASLLFVECGCSSHSSFALYNTAWKKKSCGGCFILKNSSGCVDSFFFLNKRNSFFYAFSP